MADSLHLIHGALVLLLPFLIGVYVGIEVVRRRPKSTDELFGELMRARITGIYERRQFVGNCVELSSSFDLPMMNGRKVEIIVRETA